MDGKVTLQRISGFAKLQGFPPLVRRVIVGVVGGTVLLIGIALVFLPGPAFVVIPIGLAILATEFAWARFYLNKAKQAAGSVKRKFTRTPQ